MESVNFEASGEEIERALMDLGPLLGVSIKEETPDEAPDPAAPPPVPASASASVRPAIYSKRAFDPRLRQRELTL